MIIYDSLSEKKIPLKKTSKRLNMFVCGPTVYGKTHLGHARTYIVFDILARFLKSQGQKIYYLQNITDVDDKIINTAKEQKESPFKIALKYEKEYLDFEKRAGIKSVDKHARASKHIKEIIKQIKSLIKKGFAYQTPNGIYFEIKKDGDYGKLSKQNLEELRPGWRKEIDINKKDPLDFALWKKSGQKISEGNKKEPLIIDSEPLWKSPWGWGRPGWHREDTAITEKYFGVQYDIHGGGVDLKFPHHESEIAQQEASSGKKPFVKIWMHTGFLMINGKKMSKSLDNFILTNDFIEKYDPNVLKIMIFGYHYRSPFDYSEKIAEQSRQSLASIKNFLGKINFILKKQKRGNKNKNFSDFKKNFIKSIEDDLNTPKALAVLFDLINSAEKEIYLLNKKSLVSAKEVIVFMLDILGVLIRKNCKIPAKIAKIAKEREQLRGNKQFIQADALRNKINSLGYILDDTPLGTIISKKNE